VPVLYGSAALDGAFSETLFHSVPVRGPKRAVRRGSLKSMLISTLAATRELMLAQLHGYGIGRLGISRGELIETGPNRYSQTVLWAQALHACNQRIDGLVWVSRQHDTSLSLVLFGDRVRRAELAIVEPPLPLYPESGFAMVQEAAEKAGIGVVTIPG